MFPIALLTNHDIIVVILAYNISKSMRLNFNWQNIFLFYMLHVEFTYCHLHIVIVSVCGNTMCYLNYREAEVQVLKRT